VHGADAGGLLLRLSVGPGRMSLDNRFGIVHSGAGPLFLAVGVGVGAGLLVLATDWRVPAKG
jgi:hypothetical protein